MVERLLIPALAALALSVASPLSAMAQGFNIGAAANFAILIDGGSSLTLTGTTVNGNVGIASGASSVAALGAGAVINGNLDYAGTSPGAPSSGTVNGSVLSNVSQVTSAISTLQSLSTTYGTSGTLLAITAGSGTQTVTVAANTTSVYDVSAWSLSNGGTLTISGAATSYVVFDFASGVVPSFNGAVAVTGGIASSHVLFNYTGTSAVTGSAANAVINGIIDAANATVSISNAKINGTVLADSATTGASVTSSRVTVPEPASLCVAVAGLAGLALARRSRRKPA